MFDEELITAVEQLDEDQVLQIAARHLQINQEPDEIIGQVQIGMVKVGMKYEQGEYFIADLIIAGKIFEEVVKLTIGSLRNDSKTIGKILVGTVQGDLHDIGKNIFINMAQAAGFRIYDIGTDVPPRSFIEKVKEVQPQIVVLSGVMTLSIESMKTTIGLLEEEGLRQQTKILVAGNHINNYIAGYLNADAFASSIEDGIKICKNFVRC